MPSQSSCSREEEQLIWQFLCVLTVGLATNKIIAGSNLEIVNITLLQIIYYIILMNLLLAKTAMQYGRVKVQQRLQESKDYFTHCSKTDRQPCLHFLTSFVFLLLTSFLFGPAPHGNTTMGFKSQTIKNIGYAVQNLVRM